MQYFIFKNKEVSTYSSFFIKISSIFFDRSSYGIHSICQSLESLITIQGCCCNHIKRCCYQIYLKRQWTTSSDYVVLFCLNVKSICILNNFQVTSLMPNITLARLVQLFTNYSKPSHQSYAKSGLLYSVSIKRKNSKEGNSSKVSEGAYYTHKAKLFCRQFLN